MTAKAALMKLGMSHGIRHSQRSPVGEGVRKLSRKEEMGVPPCKAVGTEVCNLGFV